MKTMKKMILGLILMLATSLTFAQDVLSTYTTYDESSYNVLIETNSNNECKLYVFTQSKDNLVEEIGFILNSDKRLEFVENFEQAKVKYIEWADVSKKNNITSAKEYMDIKNPNITGIFYYGDWKYDAFVKTRFSYIVNDGAYFLVLQSGEMTSGSNSYIKCSGFIIIFKNVEEIEKFINAISTDTINEYMKNKNTNTNLFN
jgi:hypothetical protein